MKLKRRKKHIPARELSAPIRARAPAVDAVLDDGARSRGAIPPPGRIEFDVLVIDEASQVRPEDSLGSLARAEQIVIVGDSKQMPPSDVFSVHAERDEDDEDEAAPAEELESVLDVFSKFLSAPALGWHYRSQHHSLILYRTSFSTTAAC